MIEIFFAIFVKTHLDSKKSSNSNNRRINDRTAINSCIQDILKAVYLKDNERMEKS